MGCKLILALTVLDEIKENLNVPYNVNLATLTELDYVISNIVSVFLGLVIYGILILLTLITAFDIVYLTIPAVRDRVLQLRIDGTKENVLRVFSRDAINSVEESYLHPEGKSALSIYLGKRVKTYFISVFLLLLFIGFFGYVRDIIANIISIIIKAIVS